MSLRLCLTCDGHHDQRPCRTEHVVGLAFSPHLRSDDPDRVATHVPALVERWRIGAATHSGDLCPRTDHDEDDQRRRRDLEHAHRARGQDHLERMRAAQATLDQRRASEALS